MNKEPTIRRVSTVGRGWGCRSERYFQSEEQASCIVPSLAPPPQAAQQRGWSCLGECLRARPLQLIRCTKTNMAQMKEQHKTSELSDEEIANLSDGEFKALVIKMLTELIELGRKMKEQMKDTQN